MGGGRPGTNQLALASRRVRGGKQQKGRKGKPELGEEKEPECNENKNRVPGCKSLCVSLLPQVGHSRPFVAVLVVKGASNSVI